MGIFRAHLAAIGCKGLSDTANCKLHAGQFIFIVHCHFLLISYSISRSLKLHFMTAFNKWSLYMYLPIH